MNIAVDFINLLKKMIIWLIALCCPRVPQNSGVVEKKNVSFTLKKILQNITRDKSHTAAVARLVVMLC